MPTIVVLAIASIAVVWWIWRGSQEDGNGALDPAIGIDLRTLVGRPAPILTLADAEGRHHRVPARGRPTVLIFHMGLF
jgi:hypothetical protein